MATSISLQKVFAASTSYVADHESNYTSIETAINALYAAVQGTGGSAGTDQRVNELYDTRNGIFGKASYKPVAATLSPSPYDLTVAAGAYWSGTEYRNKATSTTIALLSFSTGTLYLQVPTGGVPTVATSATGDTVWQFAWDDTTHVVSAVTLYSTAEILFDGDDYANAIAGYEDLTARLAALDAVSSFIGGQYAEDAGSHSGLDFAFFGGYVHNDNVVTNTAAGSVTLTNNDTNYVELNISSGAVSANVTSFTSGYIPLFVVTTSGGSISVVTDNRTWARGGGTGSHAQNTDLGTDSADFKLLRTATGAPSSNATFSVERGDENDVNIRWNETDDQWEFTNDGVTWTAIGTGSGGDLGSQELTKYVPFEDPTAILELTSQDTSLDYVQLDIGPTGSNVISSAPQGCSGVVVRVQFWDSAPGAGVNAKFRQYGGTAAPTKAYTVWGGTNEEDGVMTLILPGDDGNDPATIGFEYYLTASGSGTANVRVFLLGYFQRVTGVGTQTKTKSYTGLAVSAASSQTFDKTAFLTRGLIYNLTITETGGTMTGTYDVEIYAKDTFLAADLLYQAVAIDATAGSGVYTDRLPFMYLDSDSTSELHVKIINNDGSFGGTFTLDLTAEQFL